jgi:hypothetical protein
MSHVDNGSGHVNKSVTHGHAPVRRRRSKKEFALIGRDLYQNTAMTLGECAEFTGVSRSYVHHFVRYSDE